MDYPTWHFHVDVFILFLILLTYTFMLDNQ